MISDSMLDEVQRYYSDKIQTHGATACGVDWNSADSQRLRFEQLLKVCRGKAAFKINDYGCGYGALADYLKEAGYSVNYCGFDFSAQMIAKAKELHGTMSQVDFVSQPSELGLADYTVASGIFNVKLRASECEWQSHVLATLEAINNLASKGFAFNVLTKYSDTIFMRPDLYYADPLFFFDHCKRHFSRFVTLLHDYPLYEFTILVRKD